MCTILLLPLGSGCSSNDEAPASPRALSEVRCISELAELAGDQEGRLLADVDGVVADPLETARDEDHPQPPFPLGNVAAEVQHAPDGAAVRTIDQLVEVDERRGGLEIAPLERVECDADHLLGALPHFLERLDEPLVRLDV